MNLTPHLPPAARIAGTLVRAVHPPGVQRPRAVVAARVALGLRGIADGVADHRARLALRGDCGVAAAMPSREALRAHVREAERLGGLAQRRLAAGAPTRGGGPRVPPQLRGIPRRPRRARAPAASRASSSAGGQCGRYPSARRQRARPQRCARDAPVVGTRIPVRDAESAAAGRYVSTPGVAASHQRPQARSLVSVHHSPAFPREPCPRLSRRLRHRVRVRSRAVQRIRRLRHRAAARSTPARPPRPARRATRRPIPRRARRRYPAAAGAPVVTARARVLHHRPCPRAAAPTLPRGARPVEADGVIATPPSPSPTRAPRRVDPPPRGRRAGVRSVVAPRRSRAPSRARCAR